LKNNSKLLSKVRVAICWVADSHAVRHEELVLFIVMHIDEILIIDLFSSSQAGGQGFLLLTEQR
jgi:hypothetical protein